MASLVVYESDSCLTDLEKDEDYPARILLKQEEKLRFEEFHEEKVKKREHALKESEQTLRWEIDVASQVLFSGFEKIIRKVSSLNICPSDELPKSQEYSGLPNLVYQTINMIDEIVEQLIYQMDVTTKLDVSHLEVSDMEIVQEKLNLAEKEIDVNDSKFKILECKLEEQKPLMNEQFSISTRVHKQVDKKIDDAERSSGMFLKEEMDMEENLWDSLSGMEYLCELMKIIVQKVKDQMAKKSCETRSSNETVTQVMREKELIWYLLRSVLSRRCVMNSSSMMGQALEAADESLKDIGLDTKLRKAFENGDITGSLGERGGDEMRPDESYSLAGAMENIVRVSQLEITKLQSSLEELRAESSLQRTHVEAQAKMLSQSKRHIEELEQKERLANQNVEWLVMDIIAAGK